MPDDYSANVQTTGVVAVGGSATGSIETAHDQDWFAVELVAGRTYQFDLGGSPSGGGTLRDTFLRAIYDSEGRYQSGSYNDDFEGGRDSRVTFTASQSGTYYVRASGDRDETGSYTLRVTDVTPGSVEDPPPVEPPADTVAPAEADPARAGAEDLGDITELAAARFPLGTLDGGADGVAWYRFTLSEARAVGLGLRRQDADADLVLEDAAGNMLHSSANDGTANEWMRETLLAGTYHVRVEAQEAGANAYVFRYGVGDADPAEVARLEADRTSAQEQVQQQPPAFGSQFYGFELPEDTDGSANRISLGTVSATDPDGGSVSYSIEGGNAAGLFEIDAASGELFYTGGGEDYETGSTSFELTVRASDGDQTTDTTATVNVTDVDEPVEVDPPVAQPDQSTPQTVSEPAGEDFSAGASTSGRVAVGDTATGNIGSNGDRDWFAVDLRGGPTDDGTLSDPYLGGIHDSDGNLIARTTNDDGGEELVAGRTYVIDLRGGSHGRRHAERSLSGRHPRFRRQSHCAYDERRRGRRLQQPGDLHGDRERDPLHRRGRGGGLFRPGHLRGRGDGHLAADRGAGPGSRGSAGRAGAGSAAGTGRAACGNGRRRRSPIQPRPRTSWRASRRAAPTYRPTPPPRAGWWSTAGSGATSMLSMTRTGSRSSWRRARPTGST